MQVLETCLTDATSKSNDARISPFVLRYAVSLISENQWLLPFSSYSVFSSHHNPRLIAILLNYSLAIKCRIPLLAIKYKIIVIFSYLQLFRTQYMLPILASGLRTCIWFFFMYINAIPVFWANASTKSQSWTSQVKLAWQLCQERPHTQSTTTAAAVVL